MAYATITKPTDYFNTKLYAGTGSSNAITGVGHQPDLIWLKSRTNAEYHVLYDSVRGSASNYKQLYSNATNAEVTPGTPGLTAIGSDGFTVGANDNSNNSSENFVSWNWKAGTTSGITQGGASITPTAYSFNQTAGISIIKYTGGGGVATVPHGLGVAPAVIICRNTTDAENWVVYHHKNTSAPATDYLLLNSNQATTDGNTVWNDVAPTANLFTIGTSGAVSGNGDNHIAYCFAEKKGYSKFGSYTGNGNADGAFVYCGFKPAWVTIKPTTVAQNWQIHDTKRDGYNPNNDNLSSNNTNAEADNKFIDIVSNGFKLRRSDVLNVNNDPYIYMAFAEAPLVGSNNVPCTAR